MDKTKLEEIVKNSKTQTECLHKLGLRAAGGNFNTLKKYIKKYNIDVTHFNSDEVRIEKLNLSTKNRKIQLNEILVEGSFYNRSRMKERLYECGIKERNCELCGQGEEWMGKKMSLIIDHINGVWNDNRIENLRIVCPNCNATLSTHCGKKLKTKECNQDMRKVFTKNKEDFYKNRRKSERPDYNTLIDEIEKFGYVQTGKKYNVSDNAIRKWVKYYEKYNNGFVV
jgi:hypothetical protein